MINQTTIAARIVAYCEDHALTLGGLVDELKQGLPLDEERARRLTSYCDQVQCLTLGGLVDEVWELRNFLHNKTPAICQAAFPNARVFPASELAPEWIGTAIELGQTTYVVYAQAEDANTDRPWTLDAMDDHDCTSEAHATLAACLGAILATHVAATFEV